MGKEIPEKQKLLLLNQKINKLEKEWNVVTQKKVLAPTNSKKKVFAKAFQIIEQYCLKERFEKQSNYNLLVLDSLQEIKEALNKREMSDKKVLLNMDSIEKNSHVIELLMAYHEFCLSYHQETIIYFLVKIIDFNYMEAILNIMDEFQIQGVRFCFNPSITEIEEYKEISDAYISLKNHHEIEENEIIPKGKIILYNENKNLMQNNNCVVIDDLKISHVVSTMIGGLIDEG